MSFEAWVLLAVGGVVIPTVGWLLKEVLALRGKMIEIEVRMQTCEKACDDHSKWEDDLLKTLAGMARNITRLCMAAGLEEAE